MNDRYEVGYVDPNGRLELLGFRQNGQGWVADRYAHRRRPNIWTVAPTGEPTPIASKAL